MQIIANVYSKLSMESSPKSFESTTEISDDTKTTKKNKNAGAAGALALDLEPREQKSSEGKFRGLRQLFSRNQEKDIDAPVKEKLSIWAESKPATTETMAEVQPLSSEQEHFAVRELAQANLAFGPSTRPEAGASADPAETTEATADDYATVFYTKIVRDDANANEALHSTLQEINDSSSTTPSAATERVEPVTIPKPELQEFTEEPILFNAPTAEAPPSAPAETIEEPITPPVPAAGSGGSSHHHHRADLQEPKFHPLDQRKNQVCRLVVAVVTGQCGLTRMAPIGMVTDVAFIVIQISLRPR